MQVWLEDKRTCGKTQEQIDEMHWRPKSERQWWGLRQIWPSNFLSTQDDVSESKYLYVEHSHWFKNEQNIGLKHSELLVHMSNSVFWG